MYFLLIDINTNNVSLLFQHCKIASTSVSETKKDSKDFLNEWFNIHGWSVVFSFVFMAMKESYMLFHRQRNVK